MKIRKRGGLDISLEHLEEEFESDLPSHLFSSPHLPRAVRTCCSKSAAAALGSGLAKMAETTATPEAPALEHNRQEEEEP